MWVLPFLQIEAVGHKENLEGRREAACDSARHKKEFRPQQVGFSGWFVLLKVSIVFLPTHELQLGQPHVFPAKEHARENNSKIFALVFSCRAKIAQHHYPESWVAIIYPDPIVRVSATGTDLIRAGCLRSLPGCYARELELTGLVIRNIPPYQYLTNLYSAQQPDAHLDTYITQTQSTPIISIIWPIRVNRAACLKHKSWTSRGACVAFPSHQSRREKPVTNDNITTSPSIPCPRATSAAKNPPCDHINRYIFPRTRDLGHSNNQHNPGRKLPRSSRKENPSQSATARHSRAPQPGSAALFFSYPTRIRPFPDQASFFSFPSRY